MQTQQIPFLDLVTMHQQLKDELSGVFTQVLDTAAFIGGPMVEDFERAFAAFCGARQCIGVGSGTDALRFALIAAGVCAGDIVLTVPNTFIATTEAISQAGARPDFIDVDEQTYNMDPAKLAAYLDAQCEVDGRTGRLIHRDLRMPVTAIVPVHLYGQTADMDAILELADRFGLLVIEDACQAHGAEYFSKKANAWRKAGSMGVAAAFSFYPGKNLGGCGEGGAVTTNDSRLAAKVRMLRDHGQSRKYHHEIEGYNGRLDALQAGILSVKLKRLPEWNSLRQQAASRYGRLLASAGVPGLAPFEPAWARPVYHLYVIRVQDRARLIQSMTEANIGTGIHYPIPVHQQNAYRSFGYRIGDFPVTETISQEILSLPMFPHLTNYEQIRVVGVIGNHLTNPQIPVGAGRTAAAALMSRQETR